MDPHQIRMTADDDSLREALESANIPTLLLVLAHLTGDRAWLAEPYLPSRSIATTRPPRGVRVPARLARRPRDPRRPSARR
ncbi:MAG: hypothetical protein ABS80_24355 [Pseudonocardia sp. SCN 72-51]|nr:MAG: hypothetical protein ABS80_24355 [Pseudonocardia sp. SCN 72-51]